ncbi:MAG: aminoglycoside phosphotransferase family protein [Caldilineaceae bacterium]
MSTEPKTQDVVDLLIPHPTQPQLLVQAAGAQWRLPNVAIGQVWDGPIGRINAAMQQQFGLATTVVRQLAEQSDEDQRLVFHLYLLETHSPTWIPRDKLRWLELAELDQIRLRHPTLRRAVESCFQEITSGSVPPRRAQWEQPGWFRLAVAWIHEQLTPMDHSATGPVEQVKHWCLSSILRVPTTQGWVYFKAAHGSPLMVNEALLTQTLARLYPAVMPQPLAIDATNDWLLLADFGAEIGWEAPVETREAALTAFAQLQIASANQIDTLLAHGCIDRRLPKLAEEIGPLLNDPTMVAMLEPAQQQRLLAAAPRLIELCHQMAAYNVPATLVHGDLHMSNIARRADHFVFFDWSDACVAHPFLDMIAILHEKDPLVQSRLRDAYLALWTAYEPMERLLELWQLTYPLCALHQAVSYRYIAHHVESGSNHPMIGWAMPYWFGKILEIL